MPDGWWQDTDCFSANMMYVNLRVIIALYSRRVGAKHGLVSGAVTFSSTSRYTLTKVHSNVTHSFR